MCVLGSLHDGLIELVVFIFFLVFFVFVLVIYSREVNVFTVSGHLLEIFWTVFPVFLLLLFAFPSFESLFSMEDFSFSSACFVKGLQWD